MSKQPTANAFVRAQESWALHVAARLRDEINALEESLLADGNSEYNLSENEELLDMYDDLMFWERYVDEMKIQRNFIKERYL